MLTRIQSSISGRVSSRQSFAVATHNVTACPSHGRSSRTQVVSVRAMSDNPIRNAISGVVSGIYKVQGAMSATEPGLSPLWSGIKRMDLQSVRSAIASNSDVNEVDPNGDTPLLYISRAGHYKYPPADIPQALISSGANLEARDRRGLTALEISLLSGWQNISEVLLKAGAKTTGVAAIQGKVTCPDCKRVIAKYNLV